MTSSDLVEQLKVKPKVEPQVLLDDYTFIGSDHDGDDGIDQSPVTIFDLRHN